MRITPGLFLLAVLGHRTQAILTYNGRDLPEKLDLEILWTLYHRGDPRCFDLNYSAITLAEWNVLRGFVLGRLTQGQLEQVARLPFDPSFSAEELGSLETVQQLRQKHIEATYAQSAIEASPITSQESHIPPINIPPPPPLPQEMMRNNIPPPLSLNSLQPIQQHGIAEDADRIPAGAESFFREAANSSEAGVESSFREASTIQHEAQRPNIPSWFAEHFPTITDPLKLSLEEASKTLIYQWSADQVCTALESLISSGFGIPPALLPFLPPAKVMRCQVSGAVFGQVMLLRPISKYSVGYSAEESALILKIQEAWVSARSPEQFIQMLVDIRNFPPIALLRLDQLLDEIANPQTHLQESFIQKAINYSLREEI